MPQFNMQEVKDKAEQELHEEAFKLAVHHHKCLVQARAKRFTRKKVVFQWPIKFVEWYKAV